MNGHDILLRLNGGFIDAFVGDKFGIGLFLRPGQGEF